MKIRNHNTWTRWKFSFKTLDGAVVSFPSSGGYSNSIHTLASEVISQFEIFDIDTQGQYTKLIREEAKALSISYEEYIKVLIEHQICLRHMTERNNLCWNDGLGDRLHEFSTKIDNVIEQFPSPIQKAAQTLIKMATKAATGKANTKLGTCGTCGGTTEFDPNVNNLGRAGKLNNLVPSSLPVKKK